MLNLHSLSLTPTNTIHFDLQENSKLPAILEPIYKVFNLDWREGLFLLSANKLYDLDPTLSYWQTLSNYFLTALCHLPSGSVCSKVEIPDKKILQTWVLRAPPMVGGEYISEKTLSVIWEELNTWFIDKSKNFKETHAFLKNFAPLWQKVGQVCFHLAENKKNLDFPFAFLVTYTTGFGADGKLRHLTLKESLTQYSGSNNKQALIKLLTPIHQAAENCSWVQNLLSSSEIYQPLLWTPQQAYNFLSSIPKLEESGLAVKIPNWWKQRPRAQVSVTIGSSEKSHLGAAALLDFNVCLAVGNEELSEKELTEILSKNQNLAFVRGQWIEVDKDKLQEALNHWKQVQKIHSSGQISFIEGMRLLAGAPSSLALDDIQDIENQFVRITAGEFLEKTLKELRNPEKETLATLSGLHAELRPYQQKGVNWLNFLSGLGLGACLADDMGLGKTLQILTLLLQYKQLKTASQPSLLVVPASLLSNWQRESNRFTPSLKLYLLHPSEIKNSEMALLEKNIESTFKDVDLVITTYSMATKLKWLKDYSWNLLILDEAQAIKNSGSKQTKAIKELKAFSKIALTGTPIENRLSDLWSLFDFLNPGLLGSSKDFKTYISILQTHPSKFESLRKLTNPYILRRMKTDPKIISDLPDKIETNAYCTLSLQQIHHYQAVVEDLSLALKHIDSKNRRGLVLNALLHLKQICNHPAHFSGTGNYIFTQSGKFERLKEICEEIASKQEKVLVFTQFSEIIPFLNVFLKEIFGKSGLTLHGGTPMKARKELVETFQTNEGPPYFILSLKAGGTGLTLTQASHVIHFDRWWNPAVENQATDRAFRIGQKKNVLVHKLITQGTVEEKIDAIILSKTVLASEILNGSEEVPMTELSDDALLNLITLDINKAQIN